MCAGLRSISIGFYGTGKDYNDYVQRKEQYRKLEQSVEYVRSRYRNECRHGVGLGADAADLYARIDPRDVEICRAFLHSGRRQSDPLFASLTLQKARIGCFSSVLKTDQQSKKLSQS